MQYQKNESLKGKNKEKLDFAKIKTSFVVVVVLEVAYILLKEYAWWAWDWEEIFVKLTSNKELSRICIKLQTQQFKTTTIYN